MQVMNWRSVSTGGGSAADIQLFRDAFLIDLFARLKVVIENGFPQAFRDPVCENSGPLNLGKGFLHTLSIPKWKNRRVGKSRDAYIIIYTVSIVKHKWRTLGRGEPVAGDG
jgi:hypothetical protein